MDGKGNLNIAEGDPSHPCLSKLLVLFAVIVAGRINVAVTIIAVI